MADPAEPSDEPEVDKSDTRERKVKLAAVLFSALNIVPKSVVKAPPVYAGQNSRNASRPATRRAGDYTSLTCTRGREYRCCRERRSAEGQRHPPCSAGPTS